MRLKQAKRYDIQLIYGKHLNIQISRPVNFTSVEVLFIPDGLGWVVDGSKREETDMYSESNSWKNLMIIWY